ncbi:hypothetical protein [Enterovirga rhinocerotis]|uniref:Histidine kinase n=1 Tax=Enterovirga rhinocerotis TaxID=1339210 RepID=A0A4R7CB00_9HYPH|nr:hypothetical protein [Enterovirga rhinocerotis]TDR95656.1 hypothetical protein EV668_0079 [Enterovirga rhinocerotis]
MAEGLSITTGLRELSTRLADVSAILKAAVVCAESGSEQQALRIALDIDEVLHEAQALHGAIRLIGRMQGQAETPAP